MSNESYNLLCVTNDELKQRIPNYGEVAARFLFICVELSDETFNACLTDNFLHKMCNFSEESSFIFRNSCNLVRQQCRPNSEN